jgi:hypothetical protein
MESFERIYREIVTAIPVAYVNIRFDNNSLENEVSKIWKFFIQIVSRKNVLGNTGKIPQNFKFLQDVLNE